MCRTCRKPEAPSYRSRRAIASRGSPWTAPTFIGSQGLPTQRRDHGRPGRRRYTDRTRAGIGRARAHRRRRVLRLLGRHKPERRCAEGAACWRLADDGRLRRSTLSDRAQRHGGLLAGAVGPDDGSQDGRYRHGTHAPGPDASQRWPRRQLDHRVLHGRSARHARGERGPARRRASRRRLTECVVILRRRPHRSRRPRGLTGPISRDRSTRHPCPAAQRFCSPLARTMSMRSPSTTTPCIGSSTETAASVEW
jgi:hypothetical protein